MGDMNARVGLSIAKPNNQRPPNAMLGFAALSPTYPLLVKLYSTMRIGREALVRSWPTERTCQWPERLRALPVEVLSQMRATT
jgi:hypothetical protein